ncbi:MAG: MFS transporter [Patescibacteria group bacterium]
MQRKIIRQYYILSCLFNAGGMQVIAAIYVTFLLRNGLNLLEVNLVNMVFFLTLFICEIPTGAFADIFGRKTSFVCACALMCLSMFIYGSSHTFAGFVIAEVVAGIAATFRSGAFQAWLVDSLKHHGYEGEYHHIFGREGLIRQIGGGIGAVAGSYLAVKNPVLPWFVGGAVMGITALIAYFTMQEGYFKHRVFSWKRGLASMKEVAVSSIRYGTTDKAVRFVLVVTCIQIFAVQPLNMYWQPFFKGHAVKEQHLGYLFVGMMTMLAFGAFIASRFRNRGNEKKLILNAQILTGIFVLAATLVTGLPFAITLFLLHEVPRGCWSPLMDNYLQKRIPSSERATISSFCSIAPHIGGAVGLGVSGLIAQHFGASVSWIVSGLVLIIGAIVVSRNGKSHFD